MVHLQIDDPAVADLVRQEEARLETTLDLVASESHARLSVLEVLGSVLNTKTIEGYPGKRFHAGCVHADAIEILAIERAKQLFGAEHANVQPHSGTSANLAVYFSVLDVGDKILAMSLPHGGHLSHGHRASVTSRCFQWAHYGVDPDSGRIDYDSVREIALRFRPKMIVAGASSYARLIDYGRLAALAREVSATLFVDMAHIAGLVAAGVIPSPVPHSDFVTFTCYKTMLGARGGVILCRARHAAAIDRAIFPGCQGTSPVSGIAAKAVTFKQAGEPWFLAAQRRTLANARVLAGELESRGFDIVSGGTDTHQVLVDLGPKKIAGGEAQQVLESVGILVNRNVIPRDIEHLGRASGMRLGAVGPAARGMGETEMQCVAAWIDAALVNRHDRDELARVAAEVSALCRRHPVYAGRTS